MDISVVILARNEELAVGECVRSAARVSRDIVVVDSGSEDSTARVAEAAGARVVQFSWNGQYPKKKEWALRNSGLRHDWTLILDADERVDDGLARELLKIVAEGKFDAVDVPIAYFWRGRRLKYGQTVNKRSFFKRSCTRFPEVMDLDAPGITEVEGHYQPIVEGRVGVAGASLIHDDPDPLSDWYARHNRYSDWEAYLRVNPDARKSVRRARSRQGRAFEAIPLKPLVIFFYNFLVRRGFLDGRHGFEYALSLAMYQFQISVKVQELQTGSRTPREQGQEPAESDGKSKS